MTPNADTAQKETTSIAEARRTYVAMKAAGIPDTTTKMCIRRINESSAMAVYKDRVYVLSDTTGRLDYADLDRASVRSAEVVGW